MFYKRTTARVENLFLYELYLVGILTYCKLNERCHRAFNNKWMESLSFWKFFVHFFEIQI